ncbi:FecR domain-containing protein [Piscinibacter sp.]|uniref:FecR domain-containing protein n=1 Tax=Piscinibacter sp. TaxID=1903157 RepID=UPI0039E6A853
MTATSPPMVRAQVAGAPETPIAPAVARRAIEWFVELQAPEVAPALKEEWLRWRAAHPDHERAWRRIEVVNGRVFSRLGPLAEPLRAAVTHASLTPPRSPARRRAVNTLAALLFAGGATWAAHDQTRWREWVADHRTQHGERRALVLDDGTVLILNTASAVNVAYGPAERRLQLVAGEVLVTTAKEQAARPFLVETEHGKAQALGTRFTVRLVDGATQVAVYEGAVRITPTGGAGRSTVLQAGQHARFTAAGVGAWQPADPDGTAWTEGFIVAKGMRLADFVAELNLYSPHAITCDSAVAELRVSGSYPLDDIGKVLDALSATLSLRIETVTRFWGAQTVRLRPAPRA